MNGKKFILIITASIIYSLSGFSQNTIIGKVIDGETNEPLAFASIKIGDKVVISENTGNFTAYSSAQNIHLEFSYIGYKNRFLDTIIIQNAIDLGDIRMNQDQNLLGEITVTSGKLKKELQNVTISMESIKPEYIQKTGVSRFDGILEKIPGVSIVDGQANIRGGSGYSYGAGSRVLVLYDNIPVLQFDSAIPNWNNIPTETISQVEVVKGAGSALYGSSAMNGIINILPIYAKTKPFLRLKTYYGVYDSPSDTLKKWWYGKAPYKYGISGVFAKKIKNLDLVTSLFFENEPKGYKKDCYSQIGRATLNLDYHLTESLSFGLHSNLNAERFLTFYLWKNAGSGAFTGDSLAYSYVVKKVFIIDPVIKYLSKHNDKHTLQSRIYYVSDGDPDYKLNNSISAVSEYQYQKNFSDLDMVLTSGVSNILNRSRAKLYGDTVFQASNTGLYLQVAKKLFGRLNLEFGARYEINYVVGPKLIEGLDVSDKYVTETKPIFRFGGNYKLFRFTNLRASWGQGVRFPAIAEKFTHTGIGSILVLPNINLESETGYTMEAGIRQSFKTTNINGFADFSVFQSEYDKMIELTVKFTNRLFFSAENVGNTIIKGLEFSGGFNGTIKSVEWNLSGGYLYIDPKYKNFEDIKNTVSVDYNILKYRYKHSFRFDSDIKWKFLNFGIGSSYNSFMEAVDRILDDNKLVKGAKDYRAQHMEGNNIYRLHIGFDISKFNFLFNIENLLNREYSIRPGLMEAPRSFLISVTYTLE